MKLGRMSRYALLVLLLPLHLFAQGEVEGLHPKAQELFREIWSPYCPGISLLECGSSQAQDLRDELSQRLYGGESADNLLREMYQRYGQGLRMAPQVKGREALAYFLPWTVAILIVIALAYWLWRRHFSKPAPIIRQAKVSSELEKKILDDLHQRMD